MEVITHIDPDPIVADSMGETALQKTSRLQWLDAMRGFTIVLVVAYHVAQIAFGENEKTSSSLPFLVLFRMPLFFFVSGFLAYKATFQWNLSSVGRQLWKKILVQIVPTLVFLSVFIILRKGDFWANFTHILTLPTKSGYWFTWVLLQMFVVYYAIGRRTWAIWVMWVISVAAYATLYMPKSFTYHKAEFFQVTSLVETIKFMQFFLLGNLVHRYWKRVQKLFATRWFFPVVTFVAFLCCADIFRWHTLKLTWTNLPRTLSMYCLLMMVVMFFHYYRDWLTRETFMGRMLQYVGTRTLDIYLIHFIVMPKLTFMGTWLNANQPNFLIDIMCSLTVAAPVIAFCCLISHILRVSPFFKKYLFGR